MPTPYMNLEGVFRSGGTRIRDDDDDIEYGDSVFQNEPSKSTVQDYEIAPVTPPSPAVSDFSNELALTLSSIPSFESDGSNSSELFANGQRVWHEIHYSAQWGALQEALGMCRLTLSNEDKAVRDYFVSSCHALGCEVRIDEIGNIFAVLPGENNDIPPIGIGSHLDTQPAGGRFDGVLGVFGALEVLRTIKASGKKTFAPLVAINWTNEEGARFTPGCTGSAVWASHISLTQAYNLQDVKGCTMEEELRRIGYLGNEEASHLKHPLNYHFELHIEQQSRLQDSNKKIGIVTGIQGIRWYEATIDGERAHAGSEMQERGDALMTSAEIMTFIQDQALNHEAVATVGVIELEKPSLNTVPGTTTFTIDIRHPSESVLNDIEQAILTHMAQIQADNDKISCAIERLWRSPAVCLQETAVSCTRQAAAKVVGNEMTMDLISFAGHDSALVAMRVPTSMIFVPSKDGISHAPQEYTSEEECATGVQVLLESVLECDRRLRLSVLGREN